MHGLFVSTDWNFFISVLAERSATVFHVDAAEPPSRIWVVRFSLDNKYIATGSSQGHINVVERFLLFSGCTYLNAAPQIWEIGRRRIRATFKHRQAVRCLDLSPDGRFLVSASSDARMCMWNIRDGSKRRLWQGTFDFMSVAFSPDGRYVAAGNNDGFLRIWAARTAQLVANFKIGYLVWIRSVIFTPDGKEIAIGSGNVECWDISWLTSSQSRTRQMNQIWEFSGHKVCFSLWRALQLKLIFLKRNTSPLFPCLPTPVGLFQAPKITATTYAFWMHEVATGCVH